MSNAVSYDPHTKNLACVWIFDFSSLKIRAYLTLEQLVEVGVLDAEGDVGGGRLALAHGTRAVLQVNVPGTGVIPCES